MPGTPRYLLDTDTCIWVLREREPVVSRVRSLSPDDLAVTTITEAELCYGALNSRDPEAGLERVEAFFSAPFEVRPFDRRAAREHARLRYELRAQPIGERDLIIASIAVAEDLVLATANTHEFSRVPGLVLESWMT